MYITRLPFQVINHSSHDHLYFQGSCCCLLEFVLAKKGSIQRLCLDCRHLSFFHWGNATGFICFSLLILTLIRTVRTHFYKYSGANGGWNQKGEHVIKLFLREIAFSTDLLFYLLNSIIRWNRFWFYAVFVFFQRFPFQEK